MPEKERIRTISKEILGILKLPIWISYIMGTVFVFRLVQVREVSAGERGMFLCNWGIVVLVYLGIQLLSNFAMRCYLVYRVEGKENNV